VNGTRRWNGFWRRSVGSPASGRRFWCNRACLGFPASISGSPPPPDARALRRLPRRGCLALVRNDHARMLRDVADDGLAVIPHRASICLEEARACGSAQMRGRLNTPHKPLREKSVVKKKPRQSGGQKLGVSLVQFVLGSQ
jgi:hypothetical protein